MAKRNRLLSQTELLLSNLVGLAIKESSSRGKPQEDQVTSGPDRMSIPEMRQILETAIRWQATKARIDPPEEEESEFEGLMRHGGGATGAGRGKRGPAPNGVAGDAEGVDGGH